MKHLIITILFFTTASCWAIAQDSTVLKKVFFKISIEGAYKEKTKGWIASIGDSSVQINLVKQKFGMFADNSNSMMVLDYHKLLKVEITKRQSAGRGALLGALVGFLAGGITGLSLGNDPNSSFIRMTGVQKGLILGIGGAAIGAAIGATIVGLSKHKFFIGGRKENFDAFHKRVLDMAYSGIQQ